MFTYLFELHYGNYTTKLIASNYAFLCKLQYLGYLQHFEKIKHKSKFDGSFCRFQLQEWAFHLHILMK